VDPDARLLSFAGLKDDVAVGEDHRRGVGFEAFEDFERTGVEDFGERVVDKEKREGQQLNGHRKWPSQSRRRPQTVLTVSCRSDSDRTAGWLWVLELQVPEL